MEKIQRKIELKTIENVKVFVNSISKIDAEADLASLDRKHIVDAKSILGVFSLNIAKPLELTIYDDESRAGEYSEILDRFACAA